MSRSSQYDALVNALPGLAFVITEDGQYISIVGANSEGLYRAVEDLEGRYLEEVFDAERSKFFMDVIALVLETDSLHICEYQLPVPKGLVWFEARATPIETPADERRQVLWVAFDITERKLLEERLHQVEKMNAIGQLAGGVAHDFNNQLMCIMGYAGVMARSTSDAVTQRSAEMILQAARSSARLTSQLLAFARRGQYQQVPVDLHKLVAQTLELLSHTIDKRIEIVERLVSPMSTTMGDPAQLQNALLNMALNARDAMPSGGQLAFSTEIIEVEDGWLQSVPFDLLPGQYVCVKIADTGVGMNAETVRHIFEPFFTTKPMGLGTGMGLASVYGTIKAHLGAVLVDSTPGEGSTFSVYLPAYEGDQVAPSDIASHDAQTATGQLLIVEDDEGVSNLMSEYLSTLGHQIHSFTNGADAISFYAKAHATIDVVILDMMMPGLGGEETYERLSAIRPNVKTVAIGGYAMESVAQSLQSKANVVFFQKPFDLDALQEAIAGWLVLAPADG